MHAPVVKLGMVWILVIAYSIPGESWESNKQVKSKNG